MVTTYSPATTAVEPSRGRGYLWAGLVVFLLGIALVIAQFALKHLFVPWYAPALATLAALLLVVSVSRRRSVTRVTALVLIAALAGFEWFFFVSLMKLPSYEGPAEAGRKLPEFQATLADGRPFTDKDLQDGNASVLTFFRGRW